MKIFKRILCIILSVLMLSGMAYAEEENKIRYGKPELLSGPALTAAYIERSLTSYEDGRPIALVSVNAANKAITQIIDINAEKIIHTFDLDFTGYCYWGCVSEDGVIYYTVGNKVVQYDPREKVPVLLGTAPTYRSSNINGMSWDEEEDVLYGGVPNTGNIFRCNPKNHEMTTVATLYPECYSTSRPASLGEYLYIGGTYSKSDGGGTHVYRLNKSSGEMTALPDPVSTPIHTVGSLYTAGKYIFADVDGVNYIWNTETEAWEDVTFRYKTSGLTDIFEGKYYFLWDDCFHSIDIETLEIVDYPDLRYGSHLRGNGYFIQYDDPDFPGYSFLTAQYNGNIYIFNTTTSKFKRLDVTLKGAPQERRVSSVECDDRVYVMSFKGSRGAAVDCTDGSIDYYTAGQGEGVTSNPETGKIYTGNYSGAFIYEMDSDRDYTETAGDIHSDTNPRLWGYVGENQDRPFGMDIADNKLIVGTLAKSNEISGALTVIDLETYESDVYKDVIENQGLLSVTHKDNIIYGGTTVTGGANSTPKANAAVVFAFDLDTRKVIRSTEIKIPGINGNISAVHGVKIGPDGMLYGAVAGADFVMNPETLDIVRYNVYGTDFEVNAGANSQVWHEYKMVFDKKSGYLFRLGAIIDPETLEIVAQCPEINGEIPQFAGLDSTGNAYFVTWNTAVYKVPVIRGNDKSYLLGGLVFFKCDDGRLYRGSSSQEFSVYTDHGRIMVPVRAAASVMGGTVDYDDATGIASVTNQAGNEISYKVGDNLVNVDGDIKKFGVYMKNDNGVSYIPLQTLCDLLGKSIYTDENGITFIYETGVDFEIGSEITEYLLSEVYNVEN
ncbi:MAG: copper amine oxidase N-terminal domain-containing protein [Clostridia bacterium]|nr:copper amine oxidase N-terminal domain-containing protein [Clostridia bacterium]